MCLLMANLKRLRFSNKKGTMLSRKKISRMNKTGAIESIKKARSFVVMTIDYSLNNLHVEADVERSNNMEDIRQMAIQTFFEYAKKIALTAQAGHVRNIKSDEQSELVVKYKEDRSKELGKYDV